ncbi:biliverdin-producing heme oxygenase [Corynebacterium sp. ES2794-CONJ1]|uniref:biliverdin-producing heme oxygenase n=1 Tax=unclassified Corynebacterium TaxID=2624378 RepID=UPI002169D64C|nr:MULTISPECIES: biliverdin-producing heme oxygenase [unclassified Corynebacterium]MCS4490767.1 biliverdin-producing heme oxygenase [Corynebacterium sp. ES2775-CONJ]MCS4492405.1 biliverdin-producing heme oxygenase [Corynebacterium sp. ES2715-CONJ3]MCS4532680.1 biliverdin-producing heme oxygenase [Corynebacterium sp. ES2730-CONJ]MCU9518714.1 biliverdin-producing heme oxygenase [Corynebacterium sp. ES2794-CONJ1]
MTTTTAPLSAELKSSTAAAHEQAEHSSYMDDLIGGNLNQAAFIALQQQAYLFYQALEEATDAIRESGFAGALLDPVLNRTDKLAKDLEVLTGATWKSQIRPLPATNEYIARLHDIRDTLDGPRLVAHHYVRYLGDLSGGQVIARMMSRQYNIGHEALTFYAFPEIAKLKPYKDRYREELDTLNLTADDRDRLVREASDAFVFNHNLFADLDRVVR